jgi:hypothetical protein
MDTGPARRMPALAGLLPIMRGDAISQGTGTVTPATGSTIIAGIGIATGISGNTTTATATIKTTGANTATIAITTIKPSAEPAIAALLTQRNVEEAARHAPLEAAAARQNSCR